MSSSAVSLSPSGGVPGSSSSRSSIPSSSSPSASTREASPTDWLLDSPSSLAGPTSPIEPLSPEWCPSIPSSSLASASPFLPYASSSSYVSSPLLLFATGQMLDGGAGMERKQQHREDRLRRVGAGESVADGSGRLRMAAQLHMRSGVTPHVPRCVGISSANWRVTTAAATSPASRPAAASATASLCLLQPLPPPLPPPSLPCPFKVPGGDIDHSPSSVLAPLANIANHQPSTGLANLTTSGYDDITGNNMHSEQQLATGRGGSGGFPAGNLRSGARAGAGNLENYYPLEPDVPPGLVLDVDVDGELRHGNYYAYCMYRGNGQYTRLVPADMLPPLEGIPALQQDCKNMIVVTELPGQPPNGCPSNSQRIKLRVSLSTEQSDTDVFACAMMPECLLLMRFSNPHRRLSRLEARPRPSQQLQITSKYGET